MTEKYPFLGTGWSFPPQFDKGKRSVKTLTDETDINSSLHILLSTEIGERIMQPTYGCDLHRLLFEPLDTALEAYVKDLVKTAVLYFEPRIKLEDVTLEDKPEEGRLDILLDYRIRTTNSRYNYVYPFYKNEGTNISR